MYWSFIPLYFQLIYVPLYIFQYIFQYNNIFHILVNCSSVDEHLSCFYFLSIVRMLLGTFMYKFSHRLIFSFLLVINPEVELLGRVKTTFTILSNGQTAFNSSCTMLYSHQQCVMVSILGTLVIVRHFDFRHPSSHEVVPWRGFHLHFPNDWWCWASFHIFIDHSYTLEKCLIKPYRRYFFPMSRA